MVGHTIGGTAVAFENLAEMHICLKPTLDRCRNMRLQAWTLCDCCSKETAEPQKLFLRLLQATACNTSDMESCGSTAHFAWLVLLALGHLLDP